MQGALPVRWRDPSYREGWEEFSSRKTGHSASFREGKCRIRQVLCGARINVLFPLPSADRGTMIQIGRVKGCNQIVQKSVGSNRRMKRHEAFSK